MHLGGPILGFLACRAEHQRQIPAASSDRPRRRREAGVLPHALDPRTAHPPRKGHLEHLHEPGLMALASNIHMSLLGKTGLREVALQSHAKAEYLKSEIANIPGYRIPYASPTFNEFVVEAPEDAEPLLARLAARKILAGVPLSRYDAKDRRRFLVAATEMNTKAEMDQLVAALSGRPA
jgi:glycine dehydrogenase subunit 1